MIQLSSEARNLNWLVSNFVGGVPAVSQAVVVSSDGLLVAMSDGLDRVAADRLAAVTAGLQSISRAQRRRSTVARCTRSSSSSTTSCSS